jgi:hypothetical protein
VPVCLAHNLLRWTAALGLGVRDEQVVANTLRQHAAWRPSKAPARRLARRPYKGYRGPECELTSSKSPGQDSTKPLAKGE